jgi:hypothetical protein
MKRFEDLALVDRKWALGENDNYSAFKGNGYYMCFCKS